MRIAVTGKLGQIVTALRERGEAAGHEIAELGRPELDLVDPTSVFRALKAAAPDVIVSAAAYTFVDGAEQERTLAFAVNGEGPGAVARTAEVLDVPLIHISTDYVFDGKLDRPYLETDPAMPATVYGASKLAGEQAVLAAHGSNSAVLRVAWVYSPFGSNFMKTMLRLASERGEVAVVADQIGNPTNAMDISDGILLVAKNLIARDDPALRGVFHMTAGGEASWADFARSIFTASARQGGPSAHVKAITTADYPTQALRPANSRLNSARIERVHGVSLPNWRTSLEAMVMPLHSMLV